MGGQIDAYMLCKDIVLGISDTGLNKHESCPERASGLEWDLGK